MELLPQLNFRRRIAGLAWARRLVVLVAVMVGLTALFVWRRDWAVFPTVVLGVILFGSLRGWEMSLRRQFIREAEFPRFLAPKLRESYPQLTLRDAELVLRGLRQFFMAHLRSGRKFVAMPSKLVDAAWHEYILHTQGYQRWCQAAFGKLLHHTPAEVLGKDARRNDGLRRSWYWACKEESIDPRTPTRLPLLFALDAKFDLPGGFNYVPDCRAVQRHDGGTTQCGSSFGDSGGGSGDAGSFGGSESSSGGGGDCGSGCGGGCGGGGD